LAVLKAQGDGLVRTLTPPSNGIRRKSMLLLISTPVRKIFEKHNKEHLTKEEAQSAAFHGPNRKVIVSAPTPHVPYDLKSFLEKKVPSWLAISITS